MAFSSACLIRQQFLKPSLGQFQLAMDRSGRNIERGGCLIG